MITASGRSHPGHVRPINEDAFICDPEAGLFAVADGMGGHHAGEVASSIALKTMRSFLVGTRDGESVTWPYGIDPKLSFHGNRLLTAIKLANRRVFRAGESREEYTGMGTTVVAMLVDGDRLIFASVGDSRLYSLSSNGFAQLTEDDTWVRMTAGLDASAAANHPMRHVLTNVVGARDQLDCCVTEQVISGDATFLLSTDGLHAAVEAAVIEQVLRSDEAPEALADQLVQAALERSGADNITALVVRYRLHTT
jgi:PPM family protein phosphatase